MIISFIASLKDRGHGGPLGWTSPLRNNRLDHISTLDPGELGLKAIEFNGEPFVIDTQQIKDGGMQRHGRLPCCGQRAARVHRFPHN